jgi:hypothetical protein
MYYYQIAEMNVCVSWENEAKKNRNYLYHDCIVLPRSLTAFYNEAIPEVPDMKVWVRELREAPGVEYHKCT